MMMPPQPADGTPPPAASDDPHNRKHAHKGDTGWVPTATPLLRCPALLLPSHIT